MHITCRHACTDSNCFRVDFQYYMDVKGRVNVTAVCIYVTLDLTALMDITISNRLLMYSYYSINCSTLQWILDLEEMCTMSRNAFIFIMIKEWDRNNKGRIIREMWRKSRGKYVARLKQSFEVLTKTLNYNDHESKLWNVCLSIAAILWSRSNFEQFAYIDLYCNELFYFKYLFIGRIPSFPLQTNVSSLTIHSNSLFLTKDKQALD